jgi:hypothetical protein
MHAFVRVMGVPVICSAYGELEHAVRTGHSAVEKAVPEGFFAYMAANPNVARVFDEAMTAASHAQIPAILGSYDFARFNGNRSLARRRRAGMNSRLNRMDWASLQSWHECWLNAEIQLARQMRASAMQADQDERWRPSHEITPDGLSRPHHAALSCLPTRQSSLSDDGRQQGRRPRR